MLGGELRLGRTARNAGRAHAFGSPSRVRCSGRAVLADLAAPGSGRNDLGEEYVPLEATLDYFQAGGLVSTGIIDSSLDDWDRYETLHWLAAEEWLHEHPDDPDAEEIRSRIRQDRERYLRWQRDHLGWAIFLGRKPTSERR